MSPAHRRLLFALIALLASGGIAMLAAELALRFWGTTAEPRRHFRPGIYEPDAELGWRLQPAYQGGHVEHTFVAQTSTVAQGFRQGGSSLTLEQAQLKVLALGDSCTFGRGVADAETYPAQLQQMLAAERACVVNLGVPGYDTYQELGLLRRWIDPIHPQVLVLGWLPNDVLERSVATIPRVTICDGHLVEDQERYRRWKLKIGHQGWHRSALYRYVNVAFKTFKARVGLNRKRTWQPERVLTPEALAYAAKPLRGIQELAQARGIRTIMVIFPRKEDLSRGKDRLDSYASVVALGRDLGFEVLNLHVAWSEQTEALQWYLPRDQVHLTPAGYADVAQRVAKLIRGGASPPGQQLQPAVD